MGATCKQGLGRFRPTSPALTEEVKAQLTGGCATNCAVESTFSHMDCLMRQSSERMQLRHVSAGMQAKRNKFLLWWAAMSWEEKRL